MYPLCVENTMRLKSSETARVYGFCKQLGFCTNVSKLSVDKSKNTIHKQVNQKRIEIV